MQSELNKIEAEVLKNANQTNSLSDLFNLSSGSKQQTNLVLLRILNTQHHLHAARNGSNSYKIVMNNSLAA